MRKTGAFLLLFALFIVLSACNSAPDEVFNEDYGADLDTVDFNGMDFTVMYDDTISGFFAYQPDSTLGDELSVRIDEVEALYNMKLVYSPNNNPVSYLPSAAAAGINDVSLLFIRSHNLRYLGNAGLLVDVANYSHIIDYKDSFRWGSRKTLELLTCEGVLCGVTPASWIDNLSPYYFTILANNDILRKNAFSDPHEYLENQTWTLELFSDIVETCYDANTETYGFETGESFIYRMAAHMNGVGLIDESTGTPRSAWHTENAIAALEWSYDFVNNYRDYIAFTGETQEYFMAGQAALTTKDAVSISKQIAFADALGEFSVLPFPSGPSVPYGTYGGFLSTTLNTISIPLMNEYVDETATVANAIFAPMNGIETLDDLKDYYSTKILYNSSDIDLIFDLIDSADWCYWVEGAVTPIDAIISAVSSGKSTPSQAIEANVGALDEIITEYIVPNRKGLASYFDD